MKREAWVALIWIMVGVMAIITNSYLRFPVKGTRLMVAVILWVMMLVGFVEMFSPRRSR